MKKCLKIRNKKLEKLAFTEQYGATFDVKTWNGYWEMNKYEILHVDYAPGENPKGLHDKAEKMIRKLYPNCKNVRIAYL